MTEFNQFGSILQELFGPLADDLALLYDFRQGLSTIGGAKFAYALIGGWWANPKASRAELAHLVGVPKQTIDQSLTESAAHFLQALLEWTLTQLFARAPSEVELLKRFGGVYVFDSSVISLPPELAAQWPGCGGSKADGASAAGLKLHLGLDLSTGTLIGPEFTSARTHDRSGPHQNLVLPTGAVQIRDLGYFKLKRFEQIDQHEDTYYVSKVPCGTQIVKPGGASQTVGEWLNQQNSEQIDQMVVLGAAQKLKCRLVAWRVSEEVVAKRQAKFKEIERKRQRPVSEEQVRLSYWLVYITNIPAELASGEEIAVLYRLRWQIELVFKLWKSEGGIEQWHSKKRWAIMCEFYAKLIAQLLQHQILVQAGWQEEERSLVKASRVIRQHVRGLLLRLGEVGALLQALSYLRQDLAAGLKLEGGGRRPSSYQIKLKPPPLALSRGGAKSGVGPSAGEGWDYACINS